MESQFLMPSEEDPGPSCVHVGGRNILVGQHPHLLQPLYYQQHVTSTPFPYWTAPYPSTSHIGPTGQPVMLYNQYPTGIPFIQPVAQMMPYIPPFVSQPCTCDCSFSGAAQQHQIVPPNQNINQNYAKWKRFCSMARQLYPKSPEAEALACFCLSAFQSSCTPIASNMDVLVRLWQGLSEYERMFHYNTAHKFMDFEMREVMVQQPQQDKNYTRKKGKLKLKPKVSTSHVGKCGCSSCMPRHPMDSQAAQLNNQKVKLKTEALGSEVPEENMGVKIEDEDSFTLYLNTLCGETDFVSQVDAFLDLEYLLSSPQTSTVAEANESGATAVPNGSSQQCQAYNTISPSPQEHCEMTSNQQPCSLCPGECTEDNIVSASGLVGAGEELNHIIEPRPLPTSPAGILKQELVPSEGRSRTLSPISHLQEFCSSDFQYINRLTPEQDMNQNSVWYQDLTPLSNLMTNITADSMDSIADTDWTKVNNIAGHSDEKAIAGLVIKLSEDTTCDTETFSLNKTQRKDMVHSRDTDQTPNPIVQVQKKACSSDLFKNILVPATTEEKPKETLGYFFEAGQEVKQNNLSYNAFCQVSDLMLNIQMHSDKELMPELNIQPTEDNNCEAGKKTNTRSKAQSSEVNGLCLTNENSSDTKIKVDMASAGAVFMDPCKATTVYKTQFEETCIDKEIDGGTDTSESNKKIQFSTECGTQGSSTAQAKSHISNIKSEIKSSLHKSTEFQKAYRESCGGQLVVDLSTCNRQTIINEKRTEANQKQRDVWHQSLSPIPNSDILDLNAEVPEKTEGTNIGMLLYEKGASQHSEHSNCESEKNNSKRNEAQSKAVDDLDLNKKSINIKTEEDTASADAIMTVPCKVGTLTKTVSVETHHDKEKAEDADLSGTNKKIRQSARRQSCSGQLVTLSTSNTLDVGDKVGVYESVKKGINSEQSATCKNKKGKETTNKGDDGLPGTKRIKDNSQMAEIGKTVGTPLKKTHVAKSRKNLRATESDKGLHKSTSATKCEDLNELEDSTIHKPLLWKDDHYQESIRGHNHECINDHRVSQGHVANSGDAKAESRNVNEEMQKEELIPRSTTTEQCKSSAEEMTPGTGIPPRRKSERLRNSMEVKTKRKAEKCPEPLKEQKKQENVSLDVSQNQEKHLESDGGKNASKRGRKKQR